jgi:periplasmic protein TonB
LASIGFVVVLHAGILYAFLSALGMVPMPTIPMPFVGRMIFDDRTSPLPPPPQPVIEAPRLNETAPPIIELPLAPEGPGAITLPQVPPATAPERPVTLEPQAPQAPPIATIPARAIAADGSVSDAQVETSSGHQRLDDAAVQWVRAHWRYEPAMHGVSPVRHRLLP